MNTINDLITILDEIIPEKGVIQIIHEQSREELNGFLIEFNNEKYQKFINKFIGTNVNKLFEKGYLDENRIKADIKKAVIEIIENYQIHNPAIEVKKIVNPKRHRSLDVMLDQMDTNLPFLTQFYDNGDRADNMDFYEEAFYELLEIYIDISDIDGGFFSTFW